MTENRWDKDGEKRRQCGLGKMDRNNAFEGSEPL